MDRAPSGGGGGLDEGESAVVKGKILAGPGVGLGTIASCGKAVDGGLSHPAKLVDKGSTADWIAAGVLLE